MIKWEVKLSCKADNSYYEQCGRNCILMVEKDKIKKCIYLEGVKWNFAIGV